MNCDLFVYSVSNLALPKEKNITRNGFKVEWYILTSAVVSFISSYKQPLLQSSYIVRTKCWIAALCCENVSVLL